MLDGINMKALCNGDKTLMCKFLLDRGSCLPQHTHSYEQIGYLVCGHMKLFIGDEEHDVTSGDSWCIPSDMEHRALVLQDSIAIEVFSPPRDDYIVLARAMQRQEVLFEGK